MNKFLIFTILTLFSFSCSYKPLYKKNAIFSKYDIAIKIKSDGKYEDNVSVVKSILQKHFKHKSSKPSNLKLIIAIKRIYGCIFSVILLNLFGLASQSNINKNLSFNIHEVIKF